MTANRALVISLLLVSYSLGGCLIDERERAGPPNAFQFQPLFWQPDIRIIRKNKLSQNIPKHPL